MYSPRVGSSFSFQSPSLAEPEPGELATTSMFLLLSPVLPIVISAQVTLSLIVVSPCTRNLPLNSVVRVLLSMVILSLTMISSNVGRKFAVSPTTDNTGVSNDSSSPVTELIRVLPMNRSPLLFSPE